MTRDFLEEKVRTVYDDFVEESWCDLNHSELNVDNYISIVYQQKYILKYYGAYFCELYGMYEKYLNGFKGDTLNVLSFGCGSGVDCEALNRVIVDLGINIDINYVGIDIVDWHYRPNFDWATFKLMCISEVESSDVEYVNLFVFPKSLTEFTRETREIIGGLIASASKKDCIHFLNTYVTDYASDYNRVDGVEQFSTINKLMKDKEWVCSTSPKEYFYKVNSGWLGCNYDFFKLPDDVKPFVEELKDSCDNHDGSVNCVNCKIDFIPILTSKYLAFNLLEYKR